MNLKTFGLAVVGVAFGVAVSRALFSGPGTMPGMSTDVVSEQRASEAAQRGVPDAANSRSTRKHVNDKAGTAALANQPNSDDPAHHGLGKRSAGNQGLERYLTHNGTVDLTRLSELDSDDEFNNLMAQLRGQTSAVAKEKRMSYELLFYSQDLARDASVTLDALECGTRICVSVLRANDKATLDRFVKGVTASSEFEGKVVMQLINEDLPAGAGETRRLLFSHDPDLEGVTVSYEQH